jgi:hypothetical protein
MPYPARVDVEKLRLTFMHCIKLPQVADMIGWAQTGKNKNDEKKYNDTDDGGNRIFLLRAK